MGVREEKKRIGMMSKRKEENGGMSNKGQHMYEIVSMIGKRNKKG